MEIGGNSGIEGLFQQTIIALAIASFALSLMAGVRVRIRVPRPPLTGPLSRVLPLIGFALAMAGGPARAASRSPIAPTHHAPGATPPWSEASGYPPPRPLARIEAHSSNRDFERRQVPEVHPAIHGRQDVSTITPLFPRTSRSARERERAAAMRRHPAGKERPDEAPAEPDRRYVVREGDTLWSIAERELQTDDLRAIARFWPQIHRANRTTIGADPSLILPGQVLVIPNVKEG